MNSKTFIIVSIACTYLNQIVFCETIDDVMKKYDPSIQRQIEIVSSKTEEYLKKYVEFKKELDQEFTDRINTFATELFEIETNMTRSVENDNDKSPNGDYCLNTYSHELDNVDINLRDCYPTTELIRVLKGIKLLDLLREKITSVFNECKGIYPQQEQVADFSECIKTSNGNNEMLFDTISKDIKDNLERAKSLISYCLPLSETSTLISSLQIVIDFYECLEKPAPELRSVGQT